MHVGLSNTQLLVGGDRNDPWCETQRQDSHAIYKGQEFDIFDPHMNGPSYERDRITQDGDSNKRTPIAGQKASRMDLGSASPGDCFSTQYVVYS
ncbi:hypothetical protein [Absidia glauca]|uniref:Uncharacterized protein n=1 Tax=Absidia glauca TaxID=4829 RepID=A0A163MT53_ABSGL|nr:hypothetical protein [Absidia glauca]